MMGCVSKVSSLSIQTDQGIKNLTVEEADRLGPNSLVSWVPSSSEQVQHLMAIHRNYGKQVQSLLTKHNAEAQKVGSIFINSFLYTLTGHFIRYTLLVPGWTPFCLQNCLNPSWHRFNKVLETFLREFGPY